MYDAPKDRIVHTCNISAKSESTIIHGIYCPIFSWRRHKRVRKAHEQNMKSSLVKVNTKRSSKHETVERLLCTRGGWMPGRGCLRGSKRQRRRGGQWERQGGR